MEHTHTPLMSPPQSSRSTFVGSSVNILTLLILLLAPYFKYKWSMVALSVLVISMPFSIPRTFLNQKSTTDTLNLESSSAVTKKKKKNLIHLSQVPPPQYLSYLDFIHRAISCNKKLPLLKNLNRCLWILASSSKCTLEVEEFNPNYRSKKQLTKLL